MKKCGKCGIEKQESEFSRKIDTSDGLQMACKSCNSSYGRKYREANKVKLYSRNKACRLNNTEKVAGYQREWKKSNHEKVASLMAAWRDKNPEKVSALRRNRKSRKKEADGFHTGKDVSLIFERQGGLCAYCRKELVKTGKGKFHVDHIQPLSKGGSNWPCNLQCLCPFCNLSKKDKDPFEFARKMGKLV